MKVFGGVSLRNRTEKIGTVGAGSVGATIPYACIVRGVGKHISLFDRARKKVEGVEGLLPVPMNPEEEAGLRSRAETDQQVVRTLGF
jgi:malate/lactate dehydrogenase